MEFDNLKVFKNDMSGQQIQLGRGWFCEEWKFMWNTLK